MPKTINENNHQNAFLHFTTYFVLLILSSESVKALYEGDDCIVANSGESGHCISIDSCQHAKNLLKNHQRPQHCGFNSNFPLVCCPKIVKIPPLPGQRSIDNCNKYHDVSRQVHAAAGGTYALPKEFFHMAAVGYGDNKTNILWLCGGSLISHDYVLTAAHCTYSKEFGEVKWVRLGDLDLKNTTEEANPQDVGVVEIINHPEYKSPAHYNDIALLKLEISIAFNSFVRPACLQTTNQLPSPKLQATGWGKTSFLGDTSSHLIKVDLDVIEPEKCVKTYSSISARRLPKGILNQFQICAGDLSGTGRDTCPGDSGGPLHFRINRSEKLLSHFVVIGVTSFGKGCGLGETVGVYTRVSAYVDWIENIVWPID